METKLNTFYNRIPTVGKAALFATALTASAIAGAIFGYHLGDESGRNDERARSEYIIRLPPEPCFIKRGVNFGNQDSTIDDTVNSKEGE